jgi:hypothetical protein
MARPIDVFDVFASRAAWPNVSMNENSPPRRFRSVQRKSSASSVTVNTTADFFSWCEQMGLSRLDAVEPVHLPDLPVAGAALRVF